MHLHSSPAYSVGSAARQKTEQKQQVPGPGTYTVNPIPSLLHHPSWKIGTDKRDHDYKTITPGPGTYESKGYITERQPITIKAKSKDHKPDEVPGPGSYNPNYNKFAKNQPSFKVGQGKKQAAVEKNIFVPGPGHYNPSGDVSLNSGIRFGSQKRIGFGTTNNIPGPGSYNESQQMKFLTSMPKYSFGNSQRAHEDNMKSPGRTTFRNSAGAYDMKAQIDLQASKKKGFSISTKRRDTLPQASKIPGPGSQQNTNQCSEVNAASTKSLKHAPSYSMGHSKKMTLGNTNMVPGPLDYNVKDDIFRKQSNVIIGKQKRDAFDTSKAVVPGPGAYPNKQITGTEGPKFSISTSRTNMKVSPVPGPGAYDPSIVSSNDARVIIGREKRSSEPKLNHLGPGQYDPYADHPKGKGFTIGHQKRDSYKSSGTPGPGQYQMQSTIANIPKYNSTSSKS